MAFRYLDWRSTKNVPSGGFRLALRNLAMVHRRKPFLLFPIDGPSGRTNRPETIDRLGDATEAGKDWRDQGRVGPQGQRAPERVPASGRVLGVLFRTGKRAAIHS